MAAIALTVGVIAVTTGTDTKLRAYNIPLLPLPLAQNSTIDSKQAEAAHPAVLASPTPLSQSAGSTCRSDCTFTACPTGLSCMAQADDDGRYSYTCLNPKCSGSMQNDQCVCLSPTPRAR